MSTEPGRHDELQALMNEALNKCLQLQAYSDDNFQVFLGDDDEKILEVIACREELIDSLLAIEYKVDLILDAVDEYENGRALPEDIDDIRRTVRQVLGDINAKDFEIMKIVSGKMQAFRNETLKVRNKKNISAYMKASSVGQPGDSVDFTK